MKDSFIPAFYPIQNYAGGSLTALERQRFKDMSSIRVGPAQLRLVRMKESEFKQSRYIYVWINSFFYCSEETSFFQWTNYIKDTMIDNCIHIMHVLDTGVSFKCYTIFCYSKTKNNSYIHNTDNWAMAQWVRAFAQQAEGWVFQSKQIVTAPLLYARK